MKNKKQNNKYYLVEKDTGIVKLISDGKIGFDKKNLELIKVDTTEEELIKVKNGNVSFLKKGKLSFDKVKYKNNK